MEECEPVQRKWSRSRQVAHQVHHLPRQRTGAVSAGLLRHRAHVQHVPGFRQAHRRSLQSAGASDVSSVTHGKVKVPAGVEEGARILYSGEGEAGL